MLLLQYRTLPPEQSLPVDQRWRTIELDPDVFDGLDLTGSAGISAAIRRVNDGKVANVDPIPPGATVYLADTDDLDNWSLELSVTKAT
jgi:hypothetical protein